jgi:hypothetical protein
MTDAICRACGEQFVLWRRTLKYCDGCRTKYPGVYRYICPDGRSYVGSAWFLKLRPVNGLSRSNARIDAALKEYPAETRLFEILEVLTGLAAGDIHHGTLAAEQRHIDRLGTLNPDRGINVVSAMAADRRPPKFSETAS